jgi:hypothetical protein
LPLSLPLGGGLLLLGGVGLLFVDVGQLALASIIDPSGHVFVDGGVAICGAGRHDGSLGFVLQSTGGGVPVVQLLMHEGPVPFPPDAGTIMFFVGRHVPL